MLEKNNRIKNAIDKIEPTDDAKERMLANIRKKAAEKSAVEEGAAKEPKRAKILSFNRAMKWAMPLAACFVILLAGAFIAPQLFASLSAKSAPQNADYMPSGESGSQKGAEDAIGASDSELAPIDNPIDNPIDSPVDNPIDNPTGNPADTSQNESPNTPIYETTTEMPMHGIEGHVSRLPETFELDGHKYTLYTQENGGSVAEQVGQWIDSDTGAQLFTKDGESFEIVWTIDDTSYSLTNSDGATAEEIIQAYQSIK